MEWNSEMEWNGIVECPSVFCDDLYLLYSVPKTRRSSLIILD